MKRSRGNLLTITETPGQSEFAVENARTTTFIYEGSFNQVESIVYPNGLISGRDIDGHGNVKKVTTSGEGIQGIDYSYQYNTYGQLEKETTPFGTTGYEYHTERAPGNEDATAAMRTLDGNTGGYLKKITSADDSESNFDKYYKEGTLHEYSDSQGTSGNYEYNGFDEPKKEQLTSGGTGSLSNLSYKAEYEHYGNGTLKENAVVKDDLRITTGYTYDTRNNVERVLDDRGTTNYTYDKNDNITRIIDPANKVTEFTYDHRDLLETVRTGETDDSKYTFDYDKNGNMAAVDNPYG
ncbi:MAG: hypothetical protein GY765_04895, partial [bacterium]|nr:hypothetical protein [bacterium]